MNREERSERWEDLSGRVGAALGAWRAEHPRATWREIETAVDECWREVRAQLVKEVAEASPSQAVGRAAGSGEPLRCRDCGTELRDQGKRTRCLTTEGQQVIGLERSYGVCPACRTGHFPPG